MWRLWSGPRAGALHSGPSVHLNATISASFPVIWSSPSIADGHGPTQTRVTRALNGPPKTIRETSARLRDPGGRFPMLWGSLGLPLSFPYHLPPWTPPPRLRPSKSRISRMHPFRNRFSMASASRGPCVSSKRHRFSVHSRLFQRCGESDFVSGYNWRLSYKFSFSPPAMDTRSALRPLALVGSSPPSLS